MKNQALMIDDYLAHVLAARREALTRLRDFCSDVVSSFDGGIA